MALVAKLKVMEKIKDALDTLHYKVKNFIDFFRYDLPRFCRNIWLFRKDLYHYRWYSGHYAVFYFMRTALKDMYTSIDERGIEEKVSRSKKVQKMKRAVELIEYFLNQDFVNIAEDELGSLHIGKTEFVSAGAGCYKMVDDLTEEQAKHNSKVYKRSHEIEEELWNELWVIIKGQSIYEYREYYDKTKNKNSAWDKWFDGSGMRGWWD